MARPPVPRPLERQVLVEAGHRCAIPTCRQTPVEVAHIDPWSKVQEHAFDNLIALCPTCHARYDRGEIDRQSMLAYKANLGILSERYGDLERRILAQFAEHPEREIVGVPGGMEILLMYLLEDGLLSYTGQDSGVSLAGMPSMNYYRLTAKGKDFVDRWLAAEALE